MGFLCENAHYSTAHSGQTWIETVSYEQLASPVAHKSPGQRAGNSRKHKKLHQKATVAAARPVKPSSLAESYQGTTIDAVAKGSPATTTSGTSFHYPFNLFHPFHACSLQYSAIILDKLSQFITKHVATGGCGSPAAGKFAPVCASDANASGKLPPGGLHSHDSGCRSFPEELPPQYCASKYQTPSSSPSSVRPRLAAVPGAVSPISASPSSSAPSSSSLAASSSVPCGSSSSPSSCDYLAASIANTGSTTTATGCTKRLSAAIASPSSSTPSSSLPPPPPQGTSSRSSFSLFQLPATTSPSAHQTTNSISKATTTHAKTGATAAAAAAKSSSHYLVRHSLCLYAASSVILALCYLTIPTVASDTPHAIFAEGKSDKEILDDLLKSSRYDKRLLPPVDGSLTVNVSVLLLSLASPDESSLKYEVEFLLQQQWYDPRLRYANQSQYEFLNAIHHHGDIWVPDTYFIMHGDFKDPIIPMHFALRIYRNGTINYLMRRHLILSCQGRLNIFPFDDPLCSFALESISYEQSAIRYVWKNDEDTLRKSPSLTTLNAYLIQNQTITCPIKASWRGNYSCLKVDLMFTRDRAFYFTTVFIPGIILVTSSFITFWLEWNAVPARVMIGVTTMLNFFTTSNGFRSTLPVVSNLTAMNVWDGVCMCFIYASLLEFVCVNYVGRKRPLHNVVYRPGENPVTQRLPAVLNRIGIILASPLETIEREFHTAIAAEKTTAASNPTASAGAALVASTATAGRVVTHQPDTTTQPAAVVTPEALHAGPKAASVALSQPEAATTPPPKSESVLMEEGLGESASKVGGSSTVRQRLQRQPTVETKINEIGVMETSFGVKKRESSGPNEIVACTSCAGGTSPCTHSANNGCATETCFVQVRKKEPPHPIRVAKTIDVIARITFPSAYAVFLIFFFIHYKGFS